MIEVSNQRDFESVGQNLFLISNMLLNNQKICKLLKYTSMTPLSESDIEDTSEMMHKNIRLVPKMPDELTEKGSYIIVLLDSFDVIPENSESQLVEIRFDIFCPMDEWAINENSLRPFLIMSEVKKIFDRLQIKGIGKLYFTGAKRIVGSDVYAGYSMRFVNHEFN